MLDISLINTNFSDRLRTVVRHLVIIILCFSIGQVLAGPKRSILYINSYHQGYQWSDGIVRGINDRVLVEDVDLTTFYMDTKRKKSYAEIKQSALEAKNKIIELKPDVVIVSDDYAVKELIVPYFENASIPFVFCGLDWDAAVYGLPVSNATGMLETDHISAVVDLLKGYASGDRVGFLSIDDLSGHRANKHYASVFGKAFEQVYLVSSMHEWAEKLALLQSEVDMMILGNPEGIDAWDKEQAEQLIMELSTIPIGSTDIWLAPLSLVTIAKVAEEQGWWAADKAIQILNGKSPSDIPVVSNKEGRLMANLKMANELNITFSQELIEIATLIGK